MDDDYARVEAAIRFVEENYRRQPSLAEVADAVGLSEYHFQRLFTRWAGISPKRFLQFVTLEHAKPLVRGQGVLDAAYDAGLSAPSRLHDLFISFEAMTPGEYKDEARGMEIRYGFHASPFGRCLIAITLRGVCWLQFTEGMSEEAATAVFVKEWPAAVLIRDDVATRPSAEDSFGGRELPPIHARGTNFQVKVWQALLQIPYGDVISYEDLAAWLGRPSAVRAVASANACNKIAYLIPCHRVIRKDGSLGGYAYGLTRKRAMIAYERTVREEARSSAATA